MTPENKITFFYKKLYKWRLPALVFFAILCAVAPILSCRLKIDEDYLKLLPVNDPVVSQYKELMSAFNLMDTVFICIGEENMEKPDTGKIISSADFFVDKLSASGYFDKISYRWEQDEILSIIDVLKSQRQNIFTGDYRSYLEKNLAPEAVSERLTAWKKFLTESPAPVAGKMLYSDPLGTDNYIMGLLQSLRSSGAPLTVFNGRLFSSDMSKLFIFAKPRFPSSDLKAAENLVVFMRSLCVSVPDRCPGLKVSYLAGHRFSVENAGSMKNGVKTSMTISIIAIALMSLLFYRRPVMVALTFIPAFCGCLFALGAISLLSPDISAISIGCGTMLVGISVDYGIHFLYHIDRFRDKDDFEAEISLLGGRIFFPLFLSALTTIGAFLTLQFSVLPGYRQLSLFSAAGILGALVFALFVVPLLAPWFRFFPGMKEPIVDISGIIPLILKYMGPGRRLLPLSIVVAVSVVSFFGIIRLKIEGDVNEFNAVSDGVKAERDAILKTLGDPVDSATVAVRGADIESAFELSQKVFAVLHSLKNDGTINGFTSISSVMPGLSAVKANRQRWRDFWDAARISELKKCLDDASVSLRIKQEALKDVFDNIKPVDINPLRPSDLENTVLSNIISGMFARKNGVSYVISRANVKSSDDYKKMSATLKSVSPDGIIIHKGTEFVKYIVGMIMSEIIRISLISFVVIVGLLLLFYRNIRVALLAVLPLLATLLWTFGIMGWAGIRVNIMNCIVSIFIFGLVVDYCIFLICSSSGEDGLENMASAGGAVVFSALTTVAGLGALCLGGHPALVTIGLTATTGISCGLLAVMLIVPVFTCIPSKN